MSKPIVFHLIDDTTAGGVTRVVDHIVTSPDLARQASHHLKIMDDTLTSLRFPEADVIVSHLSINWRNLPLFFTLKLSNPQARLIHIEHSYTEAFVHHNVRKKARFCLLLRVAFRLFDKVAAVSQAQHDWLSRIGVVRAPRLTTIRSFVDLSAFEAVAPVKGSVRVIGAIGRLEPQKGFDELIRAFRQSNRSDLELHIYGTGGEEESLKALAQEDPRIVFKGFAEDPVAAMQNVDAVVMPSRWEAYGLVALEALAARRPLFVNGVDGLKDHKAFGAVEVSDGFSWQAVINQMPKKSNSPDKNYALEALRTEFLMSWRVEVLQG